VLLFLTWSIGCGTPTAATAPTVPTETQVIVKQSGPPPDAAPAEPAKPIEPPQLACEQGTTEQVAPAPDPIYFCARDKGVRHGPFVTLFPDGSVKIEGSYANGKLDGPWKRHHLSGAIAEEGAYRAGLKDGHWRQLAASGATIGEYDMKRGTGTDRRWFDDGPAYMERGMKNGMLHGKYAVYDHDGALVIVAKYLFGRLDGEHAVGTKASMRLDEQFKLGIRNGARQIWQFWQLLIDEIYDDKGKLDGAFTIWRDSVKKIPRVQGTYDHGKRTGSWTWFDRLNNKEREGDYADGKKIGAWFEYFENKLVFSGNYTDGKPDGEFVYYDKNGNELGRFTITDGTGIMYTYWPITKKPATKTHYYQGYMDGVYQEFTLRIPQKVVVEGHYSGDRKHGLWREWTEQGVLTLEQHWKRGRLDGAVKKYVDGKLATEATYKDGKVDGAYVEYRDGKRALVGQYAADRKTGTWTEYDGDGAVVLIATYKDGVLNGPWHELVNGAVVEGGMVAGRRGGTWTRTDRDGAVQKITYKLPG
jgi:antitoxin component YwqK of YwqJK toxin-antitoxin module